MINKTVNGTISTLAVDAEEKVKSGIFFGLGSISITITAVCAGSSDEETAEGKILIFFTVVS